MTLREPLELEYWLVNVFSGSWDIFLLIAVLAMTFISAKAKISMSIYLMLLVLFAAIMRGVAGMNYLLIFIIMLGSGLLYSIVRKIVE